MRKLMYLILLGIFLVGCSSEKAVSEEEKVMQKFLQTAYALKFETKLENPENPEEAEKYYVAFYKDIAELCTEEGYNRIAAGALLADRASAALENGYEVSVGEISLKYDEKLKQANYTVALEMNYEDGAKETEEVQGILGVQETEDETYKIHVMQEHEKHELTKVLRNELSK